MSEIDLIISAVIYTILRGIQVNIIAPIACAILELMNLTGTLPR